MANNKEKTAKQVIERVLTYQEEVKAAVKSVAHLEAAIEVQQAMINDANNYETGLPELHVRREDMLAELLTGGASKEELAALDEEIKIEKERFDKHASHAAQSVPDAKQAIAGLQRKLEAAKKELIRLEKDKHHILHSYLLSEAERIGAEYVEAALSVAEKYHRLLAMNKLISTKTDQPGIVGHYRLELTLPLFRLAVCQGLEHNSCPGEIYEAAKINRDINLIAKSTGIEEERIKALGVEII